MEGDMPILNRLNLSALLLLSLALLSFLPFGPFISPARATEPSEAQPQDPPSPIMRKGPYLLYNSRNTNMTVMWQTYATPSKATIEWGATPSYGNGPVNVLEYGVGIDGHQFSYTIGNLTPGARIHYRVTVDSGAFAGSFLAAPPPAASSLTFYAFGDSWSDPKVRNNLLKKLLDDKSASPEARQTIILHPGDYVTYGLTEYFWDMELFDRTFTATTEALAAFPFMGALGIREGYAAPLGSARFLSQNVGQYYRKYFPYPMYRQTNHSYYSFDYGPLHVAAPDTWSYRTGEGLPDARQIHWLTQDLKSSFKPWKVVMLHAPLWDSLPRSGDLRAALIPVLESTGVRLVLEGRAGFYSRVKKDGITYLTLGGGGAPLNEPAPNNSGSAVQVMKSEKAHHFARFEIKGNTMTVTVIRPDGSIIETFSIMK